jgi:hypothetical protein
MHKIKSVIKRSQLYLLVGNWIEHIEYGSLSQSLLEY